MQFHTKKSLILASKRMLLITASLFFFSHAYAEVSNNLENDIKTSDAGSLATSLTKIKSDNESGHQHIQLVLIFEDQVKKQQDSTSLPVEYFSQAVKQIFPEISPNDILVLDSASLSNNQNVLSSLTKSYPNETSTQIENRAKVLSKKVAEENTLAHVISESSETPVQTEEKPRVDVQSTSTFAASGDAVASTESPVAGSDFPKDTTKGSTKKGTKGHSKSTSNDSSADSSSDSDSSTTGTTPKKHKSKGAKSADGGSGGDASEAKDPNAAAMKAARKASKAAAANDDPSASKPSSGGSSDGGTESGNGFTRNSNSKGAGGGGTFFTINDGAPVHGGETMDAETAAALSTKKPSKDKKVTVAPTKIAAKKPVKGRAPAKKKIAVKKVIAKKPVAKVAPKAPTKKVQTTVKSVTVASKGKS